MKTTTPDAAVAGSPSLDAEPAEHRKLLYDSVVLVARVNLEAARARSSSRHRERAKLVFEAVRGMAELLVGVPVPCLPRGHRRLVPCPRAHRFIVDDLAHRFVLAKGFPPSPTRYVARSRLMGDTRDCATRTRSALLEVLDATRSGQASPLAAAGNCCRCSHVIPPRRLSDRATQAAPLASLLERRAARDGDYHGVGLAFWARLDYERRSASLRAVSGFHANPAADS